MKISVIACLIWVVATSLWGLESLPRTILGIYSSDQDPEARDDVNLIAQAAEMPLNWLGIQVRFHDIAKGLPSDDEVEGKRAILTWFDEPGMKDPEAYIEWAKGWAEKGMPFIILGEIGCDTDLYNQPVSLDKVNSFLNLLGLNLGEQYTSDPFAFSILFQDPKMMGFERPIDKEVITSCSQLTASSDKVIPYLTLRCPSMGEDPIIEVCALPQGGYANSQALLYPQRGATLLYWLLDPFLFFQYTLNLQGVPAYDVTTLFGNRIAFSQIDGDGVRNSTKVGKISYVTCGEVILREILQKYWFPSTASFITCEVNPEYFGGRQTIETARKIFELPHVECGVHAFSHPLDWEQRLVSFAIPNYSKKVNPADYPEIFERSGYTEGALVIVPLAEYLHREIVQAPVFLDKTICPNGKKVVITQWSGDCLPPAKGIALSYGAGLSNINGGDSRMDAAFPSYTNIAPLTRRLGEWVQVHSANANEDIYTNGFSSPLYGMRDVIQTFQQSERPTLFKAPPRRVLPMNIYYHYYSGQTYPSLKALQEVFEYVLSQPMIALWASDYFNCVMGWIAGEMEPMDDGGWSFSNYGACRTVRFENENRYPDLDRSQNIWGFTRWENFLYIALGPNRASLYWQEEPPKRPYLVSAGALISELQIEADGFDFLARPFGPTQYQFAQMPPNQAYTVEVAMQSDGDTPIFQKIFYADDSGELNIEMDIRTPIKVKVRTLQVVVDK